MKFLCYVYFSLSNSQELNFFIRIKLIVSAAYFEKSLRSVIIWRRYNANKISRVNIILANNYSAILLKLQKIRFFISSIVSVIRADRDRILQDHDQLLTLFGCHFSYYFSYPPHYQWCVIGLYIVTICDK